MGEAVAFLQAIRVSRTEPTGWLVLADWFAEHAHGDCENYCRAYAAALIHEHNKGSKKYRHKKAKHKVMSRHLWREVDKTPVAHCSENLLWLKWECDNPSERAELFVHHCLRHDKSNLLLKWVSEVCDPCYNPAYDGFLQSVRRRTHETGKYDLYPYITVLNEEAAVAHLLFPKSNPFPEPA